MPAAAAAALTALLRQPPGAEVPAAGRARQKPQWRLNPPRRSLRTLGSSFRVQEGEASEDRLKLDLGYGLTAEEIPLWDQIMMLGIRGMISGSKLTAGGHWMHGV